VWGRKEEKGEREEGGRRKRREIDRLGLDWRWEERG
jgi:hypothetical protein